MQQPAKPACEIVLLYPGDSLGRQVGSWARRHGDCVVTPVFRRSLPGIRAGIRNAGLALIDATDDHAQAIDAFSQAATHLGVSETAVYTERMHDGLELFVRSRGAWLLLGPLSDEAWEGFFETALRQRRQRANTWKLVA